MVSWYVKFKIHLICSILTVLYHKDQHAIRTYFDKMRKKYHIVAPIPKLKSQNSTKIALTHICMTSQFPFLVQAFQ